MLLAGHAAINLASKLGKALKTEEKLKTEGNSNIEEARNLSERITGLVRHMLDMCKQLELRLDSYYKEVNYLQSETRYLRRSRQQVF